MNTQWMRGLIVGFCALALVVAVGCSSDDDNGTGSTLSNEEQLALLDSLGGLQSVAGLVVPLALQQTGVTFWDGVDEEDVTNPLSFLLLFFGDGSLSAASDRYPGLVIAAASAQPTAGSLNRFADRALYDMLPAAMNTLSVTYDDQSGWWKIVIDESETFDDDEFVGQGEVLYRDSVRFENAGGQPQMEPGLLTNRVRRGTSLTLSFTGTNPNALPGTSEGGSLDVTLEADADANGFSLGVVVLDYSLDATAEVDLDVYVVEDEQTGAGFQTSFNGTFGIDMATMDLTVPIPQTPEDVCPTDGTLSTGLEVDFGLLIDEDFVEADAEWDVTIDINDNGTANVRLQAPGVDETEVVPICF